MRDLADARLQQVKQSLGRFLSGYSPDILVRDLAGVTVRHDPAFLAEGIRLLAWMRDSLKQCGDPENSRCEYSTLPSEEETSAALSMRLSYADGACSLLWEADFESGQAVVTGDLGLGPVLARGPVSLLKPEVSLAEALFS